MLFLKQPLILPFLCHKSATTCQIGSNSISNSEVKSDLCNCVETKKIESIAPPQQPQWVTIFLGTPSRSFHLTEEQQSKHPYL